MPVVSYQDGKRIAEKIAVTKQEDPVNPAGVDIEHKATLFKRASTASSLQEVPYRHQYTRLDRNPTNLCSRSYSRLLRRYSIYVNRWEKRKMP